jgi:hypothetical protein
MKAPSADGRRLAQHLGAADWFDLELPQASWDTIISHLACSQQFLHRHLRGGPGPERYARKTA